MGDEEAPQCKVEYLDGNDEVTETTNWIKMAGRARVTYPNGCSFTGTFDAEQVKQGDGLYIWVKKSEEDESISEIARYKGNYKNGQKHGKGEMTFPNGDVYTGDWVEDKMQGEVGTYTYKQTGDTYSGSWFDNKKHGFGRYCFMADNSIFEGEWDNGQMVRGKWILENFAEYEGEFKLGRPFGEGKFSFASGLVQKGTYVVRAPVEGEEEEAPAEGEPARPPNVQWKGQSIVSF